MKTLKPLIPLVLILMGGGCIRYVEDPVDTGNWPASNISSRATIIRISVPDKDYVKPSLKFDIKQGIFTEGISCKSWHEELGHDGEERTVIVMEECERGRGYAFTQNANIYFGFYTNGPTTTIQSTP